MLKKILGERKEGTGGKKWVTSNFIFFIFHRVL
jgi:hypothetical protein